LEKEKKKGGEDGKEGRISTAILPRGKKKKKSTRRPYYFGKNRNILK